MEAQEWEGSASPRDGLDNSAQGSSVSRRSRLIKGGRALRTAD